MKEIIQKLQLKEPIKVGSNSISQLEFVKPRAEHFWDMPPNPKMGDLMSAGAKMCGLLDAEMKALSYQDMLEVADVVGKLMEPGQKTGKKASA